MSLMLIVTIIETPEQERLFLFINEFPQIVHASRGNYDASQTTLVVKRNVLHPAIFIYPERAMNHQSSCIGRLIIGVHAFFRKPHLSLFCFYCFLFMVEGALSAFGPGLHEVGAWTLVLSKETIAFKKQLPRVCFLNRAVLPPAAWLQPH